MRLPIKILLLILLVTSYSFSQPSILENIRKFQPQEKYIIRNWTTNEGLPQNSVAFIHQDKDGYLWFVTYSGLVRFDGYEFKIYNTTEYPQLLSDRVNRLFIDSQNRFWLVNELAKIIVFDGNEFKDITDKFSRDYFVVSNITEDRLGNIYVATNSGELYLYKNGEVKNIIGAKRSLSANMFSYNISSAHNNDTLIYFFNTNKVMLIYDGKIIRTKDLSNKHYFVTHILRSKSGIYFIANNDLYRADNFDNINNAQVILKQFKFLSIQEYGNDILASALNGEIFLIKKNLSYEIILPPGLIKLYAPNFSMFIDRENNLWVGSSLDGLYQIRKKFLYNIDDSFGLKIKNTYPIYQSSDKTIWIGVNPGVARIFKNKVENLVNLVIFPSWGIVEDYLGNVWVVTNGSGIKIFKKDNSVVNFYNDTLFQKTSNFFTSAYKDKYENLWLGSLGTVLKIDKNYNITYLYPDTIPGNAFRQFIEDENGHIWVVSDYGVYRFNGKSFEFINKFNIKFARSIYIDSKKRLWVGSYGNGLRIKVNNKYFTLTEKDGLFSNTISAIVEDGKGSFWFTTNKGLFKIRESEIDDFINGTTNYIISTSYGKDEGLSNIEFNGGCQPSWMRDDEGNLWFPSFGGPIILDIDSHLELRSPPDIFIEYLLLEDKKYSINGDITLPSDYSNFVIKFNTPSFYSPRNVRFKYMLEGIDKDWQLIDKGRSITYQKLPSGKYVFKIFAIDGFGNRSQIASLPFTVEAKFYETFWFFTLSLLFFAFLIYLFFNTKLKRAKAREQQLEKIVGERTESLRVAKEEAEKMAIKEKKIRESEEESNRQKTEILNIVSHDLKNPIFAIKGYAEIIQSDEFLSEESKMFSGKIFELGNTIQELVERLLDLSRFEKGQIKANPEEVEVKELINKILGNFELAASKKNQSIIFVHSSNIPKIFVDPLHFREILNNLISNAIKYSEFGKEIIIGISSINDKVKITIKDNGQGFNDSDLKDLFKPFKKLSSKPTNNESSTGLGLAIVKNLIDLNNGTIEVESKKEFGTTFSIYFDMIKN